MGKDAANYMKLIVKYLKPFALLFVLCILLLFGQAMCDLSLPNLMSDIVNVGIQQGGIQEGAPKAMSQNGMTLLKFFMSSEQDVYKRQLIESSAFSFQLHF